MERLRLIFSKHGKVKIKQLTETRILQGFDFWCHCRDRYIIERLQSISAILCWYRSCFGMMTPYRRRLYYLRFGDSYCLLLERNTNYIYTVRLHKKGFAQNPVQNSTSAWFKITNVLLRFKTARTQTVLSEILCSLTRLYKKKLCSGFQVKCKSLYVLKL
jgi:hypothetical protein